MILQKIKKVIRKIVLGHDITTYYFSSRGEDAILQSIFQKQLDSKRKGFFVDVGAYHPTLHSNTHLLYINGWNGINIDACPGSMNEFNKKRKRDINLELGIGPREETITYYLIDEGSTMNSFSKENLEKIGMFNKVKKEIQIPVVPLHKILDKYKNKFDTVDLLNIDVEGLDLEVIKSNNWDKYRPKVIVIELDTHNIDDLKDNETAKYLCNLDYEIIAKNVVLYNVASVVFIDKNFKF